MGFQDREYARPAPAAMPRVPVVTKWLLILNIGIFLLDLFQRPEGMPGGVLSWGPLNRWGCFVFETSVMQGRIWEFLTFQFLHNDFGHLAFNSIGIFFFAPFVERWWGARRFLAYYLLCGAAGGVFYSLLLMVGLLPNSDAGTPLVGASAGVFGLIFAVYRLAPAVQVRLLIPPITLTMRQLALALAALAVLVIVGGLVFPSARIFWNSGGEAGHLGGALMGLLLMSFPGLLGKPTGFRGKVVRDARFVRRGGPPKLRPRTRVDLDQESEVDRILQKISEHGLDSVTDEERRTLEDASRRKQ
ncbi:rhomboid family intramembrane serine protease [Haloferula sp. A504]|uniref:rhomboid family intramembrane serine protease n=1 Tax=Haloferula sp. A504 TaxID=3373601 RepID=UPI0031C3EF08|nr:rhomboid family intramembrane serine protease [Verrucomicrobiaceae bacterium E54]